MLDLASNPSIKVDFELSAVDCRVPLDYGDRRAMEAGLLVKTCDLTVKSMYVWCDVGRIVMV